MLKEFKVDKYLVELTQEEMEILRGVVLIGIKALYSDKEINPQIIYQVEDLFKRLAKHEPIKKSNIVAT